MLILSRNVDESIIIGDDIVVTVMAVRGNKVRLGIAAPLGVVVDRSEIAELKRRNGATRPAPAARRPEEGED